MKLLAFALAGILAFFSGTASAHRYNNEHDGTNVLDPIAPVRPSFSLFGNVAYSGYGYMNNWQSAAAGPARMPAELHIDPARKLLSVYHHTTFHRLNKTDSTISLRIPAFVCGLPTFAGVVTGDFCTWRNEITWDTWAGNYSTSLYTDNVKFNVPMDDGEKKVVEYFGWSTDHHVSPTLPTPGRKSAVRLQKVANGRMEGFIYLWGWVLNFGGPGINTQWFELKFPNLDRGMPTAAELDYPSWMPAELKANIASLPVYRN